MRIFKSILLLFFVILHLNSFSQDSEYCKKYIPKLIESTFVKQIEGVQPDVRGALNILDIETMIVEQLDHKPCIRLNCRDGFYCINRTIKGKSKPFNYSYFYWEFNSLADAEEVIKAINSYSLILNQKD